MKSEKYRIVKFTHNNGETSWAIQQQKKNWLTRKEYWVYYEDSYEYYGWTKSSRRATTFKTLEQAQEQLNFFTAIQDWKVVDIKVVKEVEVSYE